MRIVSRSTFGCTAVAIGSVVATLEEEDGGSCGFGGRCGSA
jgi:hypothetical protein